MNTSVLEHATKGFRPARCPALLAAFGVLLCGVGPVEAAGDASRGRAVLRDQGCVFCHPVEPDASGAAPNLYRLASRGLNPASFTALVWNHGPRMWDAIAKQPGAPTPRPSDADIADLFAYFYSLRYFEPPGDAGRGKRVFESKQCEQCHPLDGSAPAAGARPVREWPSIADPVARMEAMWNHAAGMAEEMERRASAGPASTPGEMADLWVFLRTRPNAMSGWRAGPWRRRFGKAHLRRARLRPVPHARPEDVGQDRSQSGPRTKGATWPRSERRFGTISRGYETRRVAYGVKLEPFENDEMADLIAYLHDEQICWPSGDADRGVKVFREGQCGACHDDSASGAPRLSGADAVLARTHRLGAVAARSVHVRAHAGAGNPLAAVERRPAGRPDRLRQHTLRLRRRRVLVPCGAPGVDDASAIIRDESPAANALSRISPTAAIESRPPSKLSFDHVRHSGLHRPVGRHGSSRGNDSPHDESPRAARAGRRRLRVLARRGAGASATVDLRPQRARPAAHALRP